MAVTKEDLYDFTRFAGEQLENGAAGTLLDLVRKWESHRRENRSTSANCAIQVDCETLQKLAEAFPDVENEELLRRSLARRGGVTTAEMLGKAVLAAARTARE
jgi:hypothetical protein